MSYISLPNITTTVKGHQEPKFNGWDILGGISGLVNTAYNLYTNKRDFDYQKALQKQIFEREDTAVQRRMEDLEAAGINPNLAAGSAAGAGSVVARSSTNDVNMGAALDNMAHVAQIKAQNLQNKILDWNEREAYYNKEMARLKTELGYKETDFNNHWYEFLNSNDRDKDEYGETQLDYFKWKYPRLYEYFNYLLRDQKNTTELLEKQNNWYTANQILNGFGTIAGSVSSGVTAGANAYKAANTVKRFR